MGSYQELHLCHWESQCAVVPCLQSQNGHLFAKSHPWQTPYKIKAGPFGILQNTNCSLWIEDKAHLFFDCPFSKHLWELCRLKLNLNSQPSGDLMHETLLIKQHFTSKLKTYKLARLASVQQYGISGGKEIEGYSTIRDCTRLWFQKNLWRHQHIVENMPIESRKW